MNCVCQNCIDSIRSRGEKIMVGELISLDYEWNEDEGKWEDIPQKCDLCEEENYDLYECEW